MAIDAGLVSTGLKIASSLFGKKSKPPTPSEMVIGAAEGARKAEKLYGINALTMLKYAGGNAAAGGGGEPAPLASLSILGDFVEEKYGQDAKDRREHNRLSNELLSLEVQKARTLAPVAPVSAVAAMGGNAAFTGGAASTIGTDGGVQAGPFQMALLGKNRDVKQTPTEDMSGFMRIRNGLTDEDGFLVPGADGEPLDIWQLPVVAGSWAADKAWSLGTTAGEWLATSDNSPIKRDYGKPDGYTEDGKPFWKMSDGSIRWNWADKPSNKGN